MAGADLSRISTNVGALNMLNTLRSVNKELSMHQTRMATGKRINEAADDPGGLTMGLKMDKHAAHLQQAVDNIGDGKNMLSVAEGGMRKVDDILGKMRVKAQSAANSTLGTDERDAIKNDLKQYAGEIDDIVKSTTWNGKKLLDGLSDANDWTSNHTMTLQTGASTNETMSLTSGDLGSVKVQDLLGSSYFTAATANPVSAASAVSGATSAFKDDSVTFTKAAAQSDTYSKLSELQSGAYTLVVSLTSTDGSATYSILDKDGNALDLADPTATGGTSTKVTVDASKSTATDTGRGFTISITTPSDLDTTGSYSTRFTYTRADTADGTYNFDVSDVDKAHSVMDDLDTAIKGIATRLQTVGAVQSRLDFKTENLSTAKVNTQAAYSRLMDADMAEEQLGAVRSQILQQTSTSMLAQANQAPQAVMRLFQ